MKWAAILVAAMPSACTDTVAQGTPQGEVYEAVYEAVAGDRGLEPLVHPGVIVVSENGSMPGHRPEHYLDGATVQGTMSPGAVDFCTERATRNGCDLDVGSWIAFSEIAHGDGEDLVWVTFVEKGAESTSLHYYRAHVVGEQGQKVVDLTLLSPAN